MNGDLIAKQKSMTLTCLYIHLITATDNVI